MALPSTRANLELLGKAVLSGPSAAPWRLERKTAALLAYLALEGATPRSRVAGLLWPDSVEATARSNLRQLLRRLRDGAQADVVAGDDPLHLTDALAVDAVQLELAAFAGDDAAVLGVHGELLEGLEYDDCPDLTDWLLVKREALNALRVAALERRSAACERSGDMRAALTYAEQLLELDAVSEVAHRRVMRLHYLNGDRGAALRAYARCRATLERELGVAPLAETSALAATIQAGQPLEVRTRTGRAELPLSVQRPPTLIGREREWAALEAAWAAGLGVAVSGEAGIGKTRLTLDFVASKGPFALVQGRPGDAGVPYSTLARSLRQTLDDHPDLRVAPWVRLELSRLVPSLSAETAPAILSDADKLRFFEALASALEPLVEGGLQALVVEDLQFADAASLEAGQYLATRFAAPTGPRLRSLSTFRTDELPAETAAQVRQGVSLGQVVLVELQGLETAQLRALVDGLGLALPEHLAPALTRHSGGNPLFALETLRSLIQSGDLTRDLPERLPVPKRLEALIAGRLERLTPAAQRLAQVAAIAGEDFTLELAADVLDCQALELQASLAELEQAQIMQRERFQHDLLFETIRAGISHAIKQFLHRKCAAFLEQHGDPARVAQHWLEAGEYDRAVPAMIVTAQNAQGMGRNAEAIKLLEQTITLPASLTQLHRARGLLGGCYTLALRFSEAEEMLESLLEVVSDPEAHWLTLDHLCFLHFSKGSLESARKFGLQALQLAEQRGVSSNLNDTRYKLGVIAIQEADYAKALELIEPVVQAWRQKTVDVNFLNALGAMGLALFHSHRRAESERYDDEMMRHARAIGADAVIINHLANRLYRDFLSGDASQSIRIAENFLSDLELRQSKEDRSQLHNNLAGIYMRSAQASDAIRHYQKIVTGTNTLYHCTAFANLAILLFQSQDLESAQTNLARALALAEVNDYPSARYAVIRAVYTLGTPEQRETVKPYLETLNFESLPSSYRTELNALLEMNSSAPAKL
jgi:DNA-binding SARP family transcriptional activator